MISFDDVEIALKDAKAIAFDTCHKIYVLMDDAQVEQMREYEYDPLITKDEMSADEMLITIKKWFDDSCGLRFVQAVSTVAGDPNDGFETLIEQGATDDEECDECGEISCSGDCWVERCDKCGDDDIYDEGMCQFCYEDSKEDEEDE